MTTSSFKFLRKKILKIQSKYMTYLVFFFLRIFFENIKNIILVFFEFTLCFLNLIFSVYFKIKENGNQTFSPCSPYFS